jgi:hypothetical protein
MKFPHFLWLASVLVVVIACNRSEHFISDTTYREKVEAQFQVQKELAKNRSEVLFGVFEQDISRREKEALQFLFAYMPLSDLADYTGEFYLQNVRSSFAARDTFSWGKSIPEEIFRHFVLPVRVNNENLDSARWVFFEEMKDRIKGMSMKDAALEVNHWCHEKVTYRGTDGRTSSPLATVKTAYGRCGEESTFTVAALRSVSIPARQCYTPRWAHGDDNHAWVEVWVDGKWHFIGACEPEAELDLAWFTGPAKRAMLVNTNVFGDYTGPEDILVKEPLFTRINILANYTNTKRIVVKVVDDEKNPMDSATVEFQLYNYAEFYPLHKVQTDKYGNCSFLTGYGDLLVWASKKERFGYQKVTVAEMDTAILVLDKSAEGEYAITLDLTPPVEQTPEGTVSDSLKKINEKRFAFEDKIRANYEQTFIDSAKASRLAFNLDVNPDTLWMILAKSRGNWREIAEFISSAPPDYKLWVFPLLLNVSEKDLRDITPDVLVDNLLYSWQYPSLTREFPMKAQYLLSPRIDNEWLRPYKHYFQEKFDKAFSDGAREDISTLVAWINKNITVHSTANYGRAPLTPIGSYELKVTDPHSRDILFVALCRSFGIPSRLEPATKVPEYLKEGKWREATFEAKDEQPGEKATLVLLNDEKNQKKTEYYIHFTLEKFGGGFYRSLDYEYDPVMQKFPATVEVPPGHYLLVTGNRIDGGTVLANLDFFPLEANRTRAKTITLRKDMTPLPVFGKLNSIAALVPPGLAPNSAPSFNRGAIIALLEPEKEPSRHFIADVILKKAEFEQWAGTMTFLFKNEVVMKTFLAKNKAELPGKVKTFVASPDAAKIMSAATGKQLGQNLPVIIYLSSKGEVNYISEGYRIGIGDDLLKCSKRQ